jgi:hypothetical protein
MKSRRASQNAHLHNLSCSHNHNPLRSFPQYERSQGASLFPASHSSPAPPPQQTALLLPNDVCPTDTKCTKPHPPTVQLVPTVQASATKTKVSLTKTQWSFNVRSCRNRRMKCKIPIKSLTTKSDSLMPQGSPPRRSSIIGWHRGFFDILGAGGKVPHGFHSTHKSC